MNTHVSQLDNEALVDSTRLLVGRSNELTAELLIHLGEIDARKLYRERAFSSMFQFCVTEFGFSEDVAYGRILVARLGRRLPRVLEAVRSGRVHLTGLRLLEPHLTEENCKEVLASAAGKSKRQIEELVAAFSPKPSVPDTIRRLPTRIARPPLSHGAGGDSGAAASAPERTTVELAEPHCASTPAEHAMRFQSASALASGRYPESVEASASASNGSHGMSDSLALRPPARAAEVEALGAERYRIEFTADRELKELLKEAQDLMRHRLPNGDVAAIMKQGLQLLVARVKKERFGVGVKPKAAAPRETSSSAPSRSIPASVRREVFARDGGQCTYLSPEGRRCSETAFLEIDHVDGFARTREHRAERLRLRCRSHNQLAAEQMYGTKFMHTARQGALASAASAW